MEGERKLVALVSADVAGYSRLMGEDERSTVAALTEVRSVVGECVTARGGRVIDSPGDALLASFPSAVEAVEAAAEIQRRLSAVNMPLPEHRRMLLRIGVNLGDVIEQNGALYGDGVNIASRLESLCEPGGVCVSGTVIDQVENKVALGFRFAGEHAVKNIAKPIRLYRLVQGEPVGRLRPIRLVGRWRAFAVVSALALLAAGGAWWWVGASARPSGPTRDDVVEMPTGPVIAVLPFSNMSGQAAEDYFADGLTEDIITDLARFRELYVLARNTTFQYKDQSVDIPSLGRKLGAGYVLEGSVRRAGDRIRVTAQLIDSNSGAHLWAERYDVRMADVFSVQDEITARIVATLTGGQASVLKRAGVRSAAAKPPAAMQAYDHLLRGSAFEAFWSKENYLSSKSHLEQAIRLAPNYGRAREQYAYTMLMGWIAGFEDAPAAPKEILEHAVQAVRLDPLDHRAHRTAAAAYFFEKQLDMFEKHAGSAISIAPHDAQVLAEVGALYTFNGKWDKGVPLVTKANALNPELAVGWYHSALHYDFYRAGRYQESLDIVRAHPEQHILHTQWKYVASYAELGDVANAREHFEKCRQIDPHWSADEMLRQLRLWNFPEDFPARYLESYAKAGYFLSADPRASPQKTGMWPTTWMQAHTDRLETVPVR